VGATTIANVEMARAWDGPEGDEWTEDASHYEAAGQWIWGRFEQDVPVAEHDDVLDVGCGTGRSTLRTATRAAKGTVLGVDLSSKMLAYARERASEAGISNATFLQADAQVEPFAPESRDLVISSYGAMFFADRTAAFANLRSALRPGGRLAVLAWRRFEENEWVTTIREIAACGRDLPTPSAGAPGPFGLADRDGVAAMLDAAGYRDVEITPYDEPMFVGANPDDAWAFVRGIGVVKGLTGDLDNDARATVFAQLRAMIDAHAGPDGVTLGSASWLITATA
jgi:SAM-dependent methyltransferase